MTETAVAMTVKREIGRWDRGRPGPTLLVLGGIHGNEPAGVRAAQRVMARLHELEPDMRGRFVALAGNLKALAEQRRFLARDLNRGWGRAAIEQMLRRDEADCSPEDLEQRELLECFAAIDRTSTGPLVFVDLHTSSADGSPFICLADTIDNRQLGLSTGVPIILGIEETIDGASLEWFADRGICGFAVEGGRHECEQAVDNLEAVLWGLLRRLDMVAAGVVDLGDCQQRLRTAIGSAPSIVEIVHRQVITAEDRFRMEPGFLNFARVDKGDLLARDCRGEIRAPHACHVVLPLYQELGDDGFFLARRVAWFWLWLAKWLRRLHGSALLPLLPGVRRDPDDRDTVLVNPKVARWFVVQVFHLLGFRRSRARGDRLAFSRRVSRAANRGL